MGDVLLRTDGNERTARMEWRPKSLTRCIRTHAVDLTDGRLTPFSSKWARCCSRSEALYVQVLEAKRRVLGPDSPDTLLAMADLAVLYNEQGKVAQEEALDRQGLDARRRVRPVVQLGVGWKRQRLYSDDDAAGAVRHRRFAERLP